MPHRIDSFLIGNYLDELVSLLLKPLAELTPYGMEIAASLLTQDHDKRRVVMAEESYTVWRAMVSGDRHKLYEVLSLAGMNRSYTVHYASEALVSLPRHSPVYNYISSIMKLYKTFMKKVFQQYLPVMRGEIARTVLLNKSRGFVSSRADIAQNVYMVAMAAISRFSSSQGTFATYLQKYLRYSNTADRSAVINEAFEVPRSERKKMGTHTSRMNNIAAELDIAAEKAAEEMGEGESSYSLFLSLLRMKFKTEKEWIRFTRKFAGV